MFSTTWLVVLSKILMKTESSIRDNSRGHLRTSKSSSRYHADEMYHANWIPRRNDQFDDEFFENIVFMSHREDEEIEFLIKSHVRGSLNLERANVVRLGLSKRNDPCPLSFPYQFSSGNRSHFHPSMTNTRCVCSPTLQPDICVYIVIAAEDRRPLKSTITVISQARTPQWPLLQMLHRERVPYETAVCREG